MSNLRELGNKALKDGNRQDAIRYYSEAIDKDEKDCASLTNRSMVYYQLKQYDQSLNDANNSININPLWIKGYYRKGMALSKMNRYRDSIDQFEYALILMSNNNNNNNKNDHKMFQDEIDRLNDIIIKSRYSAITRSMPVEVRMNVQKSLGKGVFLKHDQHITPNSVIFTEKPVVSHVSCEYLDDPNFEICSHCMDSKITRQFFNPSNIYLYDTIYNSQTSFIQCDHCIDLYCSDECKFNAWNSYHHILCSQSNNLNQLYQHSKKYKQTNVLVITRMFSNILQSIIYDNKKFEDAILPFTSFVSNGQWKSEADDIALSIIKSIFSKTTTPINPVILDQLITIERYRQLYSIIQCNASRLYPVSRIHMKIEELASTTPAHIDYIELGDRKIKFTELTEYMESLSKCCISGSALYTIANTCNHSCSPNAVVAFTMSNNIISMRSLTNEITSSQQIEISYIDEDSSYNQRQQQLLNKYKFKCNCQKCKDNK